MTFKERVLSAIEQRGPLCVGIDPHDVLLRQWGMPCSAEGVRRFGLTCVEAFGQDVAVLKPQVAFFEAFGSRGLAALEEVIAAGREAGAVVIADAKRGDIGSTMTGYAQAWLSAESPLASDAVTVTPFVGFGALSTVIDYARDNDAGVFVLARTSNPEGGASQLATDADGKSVAQMIIDQAAEHNKDGRGTVGVVVGATRDHGLDLSHLNGPILAPGLGAQGAVPRDVAMTFASVTSMLLPSTSRDVLRVGPDVRELRAKAMQVTEAVASALAGVG